MLRQLKLKVTFLVTTTTRFQMTLNFALQKQEQVHKEEKVCWDSWIYLGKNYWVLVRFLPPEAPLDGVWTDENPMFLKVILKPQILWC